MRRAFISRIGRISAWLPLLAWLPSLAGAAGMDAATVARVKRCTAFLTVSRTQSSGSAFRISKDGHYATCAHVLEGLKNADKVTLTLNPGLADERRVEASILDIAADLDLAVVKSAETPPEFLPLGMAAKLKETDEIIAAGFPLGEALALGGKAPEITLKTGRITSLRRAGDRLEALQIDAELLPGNSGGPVLDSKGRVVGIAAVRTASASLNFAIPVESLQMVLNAPSINLAALPTIPAAALDQALAIPFDLSYLTPPGHEHQVSAAIGGTPPDGAERPLTVRSLGDARFEIQLIPREFLASARSSLLRADFIRDVGNQRMTTSFNIRDATITVGGKSLPLSTLCRVFPKTGQVTLADGSKLEGAVTGMDRLVQVLADGESWCSGDSYDAVVIRPHCGKPPALALFIRASSRGVTSTWAGRLQFDETPAAVSSPVGSVRYPAVTRPSAAADPVAVDLGGWADKLCFGGGGRFAVARLPERGVLSIIDCVAGKAVGTIPLASRTQPFTANADAVLLGCGDRIERWTLEPLAKAGQSKPWLVGEILNLASGAADRGRLFVLYDAFGKSGVTYLEQRDLASGSLLAMNLSGGSPSPETELRVSGAGDMLAIRGAFPNNVFHMRAGEFEKLVTHPTGQEVPADDGWIFGGAGPRSIKGGEHPIAGAAKLYCHPTTLPGLCWAIPAKPDGFVRGARSQCSLVDLARGRVLLENWLELPEVLPPDGTATPAKELTGIPWSDRFMFSPQLGVLVTVPWDGQSLVVRRPDPITDLTKSGARFSFMSCPASVRLSAGKGEYRLPLGLLTHAGAEAKPDLVQHSDGISLSADGSLVLSADARAAGRVLTAVIRVTCPDAFESLHRLSIRP